MPGPVPRLDPIGDPGTAPAGVVLVAHGGKATSTTPAARRGPAYWRMRPFAGALAGAGPAVYLLRYRVRGWNGPAADAFRDAEWAVGELARRHPGAPLALVGHSMGGRAVLRAAGGAGVVAVCALAPWVESTDPVAQLAGRSLLVAHGDRERMTDPAASYAYALRAREVTDRVARVEVHGDGHAMLRRAGDWTGLVRRYVLGELGIEPPDPVVTNAMAEPAPRGLRVALPGEPRRPRRAA